jgi:Holliday junction resolvase
LNTARKGNAKELRTAELLSDDGWVVASRRHIAGPGDLLAVKGDRATRLIEVKATAAGPYAHFGPADRRTLSRYADLHGLVPELAWWAPGSRVPEFFGEADWPR